MAIRPYKLNGWIWIGAAPRGRRWKDLRGEQLLRPGSKRGDLLRVEQRLKRGAQVRVRGKTRGKRGKASQQIVRDSLAGEIPDHRAQFILFVETDPVVNRPQFVRAFFDQHVTAFAVGVV